MEDPLVRMYRDMIDLVGPVPREQILARAQADENLTLEQVVALCDYASQMG